MTTHLLGMAKSPLNLKGSKGRNLKLDFFQLAGAVAQLRAEGKTAKGFLLVLTAEVKRRADFWKSKCENAGDIEIVCPELSASELAQLTVEKANNIEGNKLSKSKGGNPELASASVGKELGERKLREEIEKRFPGVQAMHPDDPRIASVCWDFYGLHHSQGGVAT